MADDDAPVLEKDMVESSVDGDAHATESKGPADSAMPEGAEISEPMFQSFQRSALVPSLEGTCG